MREYMKEVKKREKERNGEIERKREVEREYQIKSKRE